MWTSGRLESNLNETTCPSVQGGLGLSSARYLLHQYFLRHLSWLEPLLSETWAGATYRPRTLQVQHHHCTYQRYVRGLNPAGDGRQPPDHKAPPPELLSPRVRSSLRARELLS